MNIGLLCEGPSDLPAITHFVGDQLRKLGVEPQFRSLFPEPDKTRGAGGWSNLLLWLNNNPAATRIARYFSGGLFGGDAAYEPLNAILIHMDADVVDDPGFQNFIRDNYNLSVEESDLPAQRGQIVAEVLKSACQFELMTDRDRRSHVTAVAVESTETWCLAVFHNQPSDFESLRDTSLTNAFMRVLEASESRSPQASYENCDKDIRRREMFCRRYATFSDRIKASCPHFSDMVDQLGRLA
ncbi:MAG: hypothetical protein ACK40C_13175 [Novosphingobium meiothermophilum]